MVTIPPAIAPTAEPVVGYDVLVVSRVDSDGSLFYLASHPELEGCKAHGATPEEAVENLGDALALYQAMAKEAGRTLPDPHEHPTMTKAIQEVPTATGTGSNVIRPKWGRSGGWTSPIRTA